MPTLFVSTTGGHLAQLVDIAGRVRDDEDDVRVWAAPDNAQSRSLLRDKTSVFVPFVAVRDVPGVVRSVGVAHRLQREWQFTRVVSTGSGIALGYLPYLAARGVDAHYIESATRVGGPSLTGRLLQRVPNVRVYTQYEQRADGRWHYGGSVFDGFAARPRTPPAKVCRAVVTFGTAEEFPFRRALEALVPLLGSGGALEQQQGVPVQTLWQTGCTSTDGLGITSSRFVPAADLEAELRRADVVISHAGTGSALSALRAGRLPILIPRDPARREIGDEHQDAFACDLERRALALRRHVDDLRVDDVVTASGSVVERSSAPPPFRLCA